MLLRLLKTWSGRQVSTDRIDRLIAQLFCFAGAAGVMACMGRVVQRFASTPFEMLVVVLMVLLLALSMVILGIVMAPQRPGSTTSKE